MRVCEVTGVLVCMRVCVREVVEAATGDFSGTGHGAGLLDDVFGSALSAASGV